jgi:hypothetical protein
MRHQQACADVAFFLLLGGTSFYLSCSVGEAELKHRQAECQEPGLLSCCFPSAATAYADMEELVREKGGVLNTWLPLDSSSSSCRVC